MNASRKDQVSDLAQRLVVSMTAGRDIQTEHMNEVIDGAFDIAIMMIGKIDKAFRPEESLEASWTLNGTILYQGFEYSPNLYKDGMWRWVQDGDPSAAAFVQVDLFEHLTATEYVYRTCALNDLWRAIKKSEGHE
jgi:hypothetical protein